MMLYYPKPHHMIYPFIAGAIGAVCKMNDVNDLGNYSFAIGVALLIWITVAGIIAPIIEYNSEKRMQMEAARNIDLDKMAALGLRAKEVPTESVTRIQYEDRHGNLENEKRMEIPISEVRLQVICKNILDGVPFSRKAMTKDRNLLKESEWEKIGEAWRKNGLLYYKDTDNENLGSEFSAAGMIYLRQKAGVPSPTPQMDMAQNAA
jgi:hypothetical protein